MNLFFANINFICTIVITDMRITNNVQFSNTVTVIVTVTVTQLGSLLLLLVFRKMSVQTFGRK